MVKGSTVNVAITPELERLIQDRIASGHYQNANEVIQEGLRLLEDKEQAQGAALEAVRRKIATGIAQADRGELMDGEAVFKELSQLSQKRREVK